MDIEPMRSELYSAMLHTKHTSPPPTLLLLRVFCIVDLFLSSRRTQFTCASVNFKVDGALHRHGTEHLAPCRVFVFIASLHTYATSHYCCTVHSLLCGTCVCGKIFYLPLLPHSTQSVMWHVCVW